MTAQEKIEYYLKNNGKIPKDVQPEITLKDVADFLNKNFKDGCSCPACGAYVKEYKRTISLQQVKFLIILNTLSSPDGRKTVHAKDVDSIAYTAHRINPSDWSKTKDWGLIEPDPDNEGFWYISEHGRNFLCGKISIPKRLTFLMGKVVHRSKERMFVNEAKKFNLEEVVGFTNDTKIYIKTGQHTFREKN